MPDVDDAEEKPDADELDEDPESLEKHADNARGSKAHKEDREVDESSSRENIDDDNDSDSGKNQGTVVEQSSPGGEQKGEEDELSDDEPLVSHN